MRKILLLAVCVFAFVAAGIGGARAQDSWWTLIESTGSVMVHQSAAAARPASLQDRLAPGATLTTGGNGRAVFGRGAQSVAVGPNSRIVLPEADAGGFTRFVQELGTVLFSVDKREVQHFEVDTPLIAAVVKGTTFTVSAGAESHAVHVLEGLVEVTPRFGGPAVEVPAGQTAIVTFSNPTNVELVRAERDSTVVFGAPAAPERAGTRPMDGASATIDDSVRVDMIGRQASLRIDNEFAPAADDEITRAVEDEVLDEVRDSVLATVNDEVMREVADGVLATVNDEVLREVTESVRETVEDEVLGEVAENVRETVEDEILGEVAESVQETVEDEILGEVAESVRETVEDEILEEIENGLLETVEDEILDGILGV